MKSLESSPFSDDDLSDIQGIILTGYGHLPHSEILLLRFGDAALAKNWIGEVVPGITTSCWDTDEAGRAIKPLCAVNLALSVSGVTSLALGKAPEMFSEEFIEGMGESHRARRLGDEGGSSPQAWEFGGPGADIHALLIVQGRTEQELDRFVDAHRRRAANFDVTEAFSSQRGYTPSDSREHFGYIDSISQPNIEGSPARSKNGDSAIKAGEFLLGHVNGYGRLPASPVVSLANGEVRDLGRNGTYLVFRKLYQDVALFRSFLRGLSPDPDRRELIRAKLVGRWESGAPLALSPMANDPDIGPTNDFGYAVSDPVGMGCPIGAHIRRTNPRDSLGDKPEDSMANANLHRIVRRGTLYGEKLGQGTLENDREDRGILFIAINADIRRQFEFIQQTWSNNPKFGGLYSDPDPISGSGQSGQPRCFTIPTAGTRARITGLPEFVTVRGGGYFFLPSVSALKFFASGDPSALPVKGSSTPLSKAGGLAAFFVATAGEFGALFYWLKFLERNEPIVAAALLLLGFVVERAAVVRWLGLPAKVKLANGMSLPLWFILVAVTVAELAAWAGWLELARTYGVLASAMPFFVCIHLIHSSESAVITNDRLTRELGSIGPILLSVIETVTASLWIGLTLRNQPVLGAVCLLAGLLVEHTLQGVGLARGKGVRR